MVYMTLTDPIASDNIAEEMQTTKRARGKLAGLLIAKSTDSQVNCSDEIIEIRPNTPVIVSDTPLYHLMHSNQNTYFPKSDSPTLADEKGNNCIFNNVVFSNFGKIFYFRSITY